MPENETPAPFMPFVPPGSAPPTQPVPQPESSTAKRETKKQRVAREKLEAKQAKARLKMEANQKEPEPSSKPPKPPRKRRAAKAVPVHKYDLQTILRVAATLKEADQAVFEKLLGELTALPKSSRERVLKALGEVFG